MNVASALPALTVVVIATVAVLSGPVGPLDLPAAEPTCDSDVFPGDGNATVEPVSVPNRVTISKSAFGAEVWRLEAPPTVLNVSSVTGRPTVSFRLEIHDLARTVGTTTVLSRCTTGRVSLSLGRSTFEPGQIEEEQYDATAFVVYRALENGTKVERTLVEQNVTVEVVE